ncbi:MAG: EcsC family protein [Myxococcota bacterium]
MATLIGQILENLSERLDEDLLPALYNITSLSTAQIRDDLEAAGLLWYDRQTPPYPTEQALERSASSLIERSLRAASIRGMIGGAGGALAIPPEILVSLAQTLRLAQRLAVVYGFVLETDRGKLMLSRALEAAFRLDLPSQRALGVKVSDLPQVARQQMPDIQRTTAWIARTVVWRAARHVGGRFSRVLPGIGAGIGAWDARRSLRAQGERMLQVYQRAWEGVPYDGEIVDAVEVVDAEEIPS